MRIREGGSFEKLQRFSGLPMANHQFDP